jgi:glycine hydroxymethyltransferase
LRLGVSAATTRGFGAEEFTELGNIIADLLDDAKNSDAARERVADLCACNPLYPAA